MTDLRFFASLFLHMVFLQAAFSAMNESTACVNTAQYDEKCANWKSAGFCASTHEHHGFMNDHCRKECGFCKGKECKNSDQYWDKCPVWKSAGYCDSKHKHYGFMKDHCAKECAFCRGEVCKNTEKYVENCPRWKSAGFCDSSSENHGFMKDHCAKECGFCRDTDEDVCKDSEKYIDQCPIWKSAGFCDSKHKHYGFMNDHCAKQCGFCHKTPNVRKICRNSPQYVSKCPLWKSVGFCDKNSTNYGFMNDHCAKECKFCDDCVDKLGAEYCNLYKPYCKHSLYGQSISKNCKKTCDACGDPPCGVRPSKIASIVAGVDADEGDWRWQALMKVNGIFKCGGTLVAKQWVLTAGHCLRYIQANSLEIILGQSNKSRNEETAQKFKVIKIIRHPKYNPSTKDSDIALLKLSKAAILNEYVTLACLPTEPPPVKTTCYITGWGRVIGLGKTSDVLQEAKLPVVSNKDCAILNNIRTITENMLCAGYGLDFSKPQSGCQGDSGGPLVCQKGTTWSVHGVVSWGSSRCIASESYTVFARVTQFVDWIKQTIDQN